MELDGGLGDQLPRAFLLFGSPALAVGTGMSFGAHICSINIDRCGRRVVGSLNSTV
jgi:hypothetical protein